MNIGLYGKTWWGRTWLESLLAGVDPKVVETALRYAQKGKQESLDIPDNRILSTVLGPSGGKHSVYLVFPRFEKEKADLFVSLLKQQPSDLLALSNDAMNPSIQLLLDKSGLQLFHSLDSVNQNCDCKDPLPCKYVITTIFSLAEKIDQNPFLLFKIHGLEIEHLKNFKPEQMEIEVPRESALVRSKAPNALQHHLNIPQQTPELSFQQWNDYSRILPAMLQNFPKFCPAGNFRKSFADELERCRQFYLDFKDFQEFAENYKIYNANIFLVEGDILHVVHKRNWNWNFIQNDKSGISQYELSVRNAMGALCTLSAGNFSWHHYNIRYLQRLLMAAFYLIRTGAVYPQVFWLGAETAQMRWLPAEMLPDVLAIVSELEKKAPQNIVQTIRDEEFLEVLNPAEHILSLFIGQLLVFFRKYHPATKRSPHENLLAFFFDCKSGRLANNAKSIPSKIQQWFSVYSTLDFKTPLLFSCSDAGDEIALEIFVIDNNIRTPLAKLFEENDARLLSVISILNGIGETLKPMAAYIEGKAENPIMMQGSDLLDFIQDSLKKLEIFGIQTELPQSLLHIEKPKAVMRLQGSISFGSFNAEDLLDFDWEVALGDHKIPADEFLKLAEEADGLLKFKDSFVQVSAETIQDLKNKLEEKNISEEDPQLFKEEDDDSPENEEEIDPSIAKQQASREAMVQQAKLIQACLTGQCDNIPVELSDGVKKQVEVWRGDSEVELPQDLNATLRPYQHRGYSWMYKNLQMGFGCILADDMGMGKTLQVITFLLKMKQEDKFKNGKGLVVMPAGLLCNWQVEIQKFAPSLDVFAYHGGSRKLEKFKGDLLLTTYATFRKDFKKLKELPWQAIVIDEAQNIKNADSEQSKLLRSIDAPIKIAMSGTPVENRLMEFWTIMDFANRGLFPSAAEFREKFEVPIQKNNDLHQAEVFKTITAPFMLRRLKTDKSVITDLPEKIIQDEYAELTRSQAALYQKTLQKFMEQLEEEQMLSEIAKDSRALFKRKGIILQMILALKQICNHPATFLKGLPAEKAESDSSKSPAESGKMEMLMDLLEAIQESGEKTLIFTQFAEMGNLLQSTIQQKMNLRCHFYHGGCTQTQRATMIEDFQKNPECKVLILSLKAGGTGLNLTAASQVIHYDLWWNPAIEAQATDRAFRIGQTRNVQVHRFITKGTFEEKINALLESKKAIANMTVSAGETWLTDMSDKELGEVFSLDNSLV